MDMDWLGPTAGFLAGVALRAPGFRIPLENNGGYFLSCIRERQAGVPGMANRAAPLTEALLTLGWRLLGTRMEGRWIRWLGATSFGAGAAALFASLDLLAGTPAAAAGMILYLACGAAPHLVGWFTCPEWYAAPASIAAFACTYAGATGSRPWLLAAGGALATIAAGFKVTALAEMAALALLVAIAGPFAGVAPFAVAPAAAAALATLAAGGPAALWRGPIRNLLEYKRSDHGYRGTKGAAESLRAFARSGADIAVGCLPVLAALAWLPLAEPREGRLAAAAAAWALGGAASLGLQGVWTAGHWVPLLAPAALAAGCSAVTPLRQGGAAATAFLACQGLTWICVLLHGRRHPMRVAVYLAWQGLFRDIARQVRLVTPGDARIFCWGWHPQIHVIADRRPAAPDLQYCHFDYLEGVRPGWRRRLLGIFDSDPPAAVVVLNPQAPLSMLQVFTGRVYRKHAEVRYGAVVGRIFLRADGPPLLPVPAPGCPWEERAAALCATFPSLYARRDYGTLAIAVQAACEWAPDDPDLRGWVMRVDPNLGPAPRRSLDTPPQTLHLRTVPGEGVAAAVRRGNALHWVSDPAAPDAAAAAWAQAHPEGAPEILLIGLGAGHPLAALLDRADPECRITIVERDLSLYREAWHLHGERLEREMHRLSFHVSRHVPDVLKDLAELDLSRAAICVYPRATTLDPAYYAEIAEGLAQRAAPPVDAPGPALAEAAA